MHTSCASVPCPHYATVCEDLRQAVSTARVACGVCACACCRRQGQHQLSQWAVSILLFSASLHTICEQSPFHLSLSDRAMHLQHSKHQYTKYIRTYAYEHTRFLVTLTLLGNVDLVDDEAPNRATCERDSINASRHHHHVSSTHT
jgi:hypothetical protein